jgi:hypothetical protein
MTSPPGKARQLSGRRPGAMDGSSVIFIVMPIVIPLVLCVGIALPYR